MQLENSFVIQAPPDRVFAYLLDPRNVVGCVPGAELTEQVDPVTFKGKVKIKVGPISVAYSGTGRVVDRNDAQRTAVLEGEGRETTGPGSGRGRATMSVASDPAGSLVKVVTEYTLTGRVAQFGRGVIEDVSRKMVREVAECIQANLQARETADPETPSGKGSDEASAPHPPTVASAAAINAPAILLSVLWEDITDPGFWDAGIKVLDGMVTEVERLTARLDNLFGAQPR